MSDLIVKCATVLAVVSASLWTSVAVAGPQHDCARYAEMAVEEFQNAVRFCGSGAVDGPRWHGNHGIHAFWCSLDFVTEQNLVDETRARREVVQACRRR